MALLEKEAIRLAQCLDDYDHVSVTDLGGHGHDHWVVVKDHRFDAQYEIASHCDYWDFIGALISHRRCMLEVREEVA